MIIINGRTYHGNNFSILKGEVIIDGVNQNAAPLSGIVRIEVQGNLTDLKTDASVIMTGNVLGSVYAGGSVQCDNVTGNVVAQGAVQCDEVGGSISAGGSVMHG